MKRLLLASALSLSMPWQTFANDLPKSELETVFRVVWGEVRSQPDIEVEAVCHVIATRVKVYKSFYKVVTARRQFSALNPTDPNREKLLAPGLTRTKSYKRIAALCALTLRGRAYGQPDDITGGCDHYFHGKKVPYWAKGKEVVNVGATQCVKLWKGSTSPQVIMEALKQAQKQDRSVPRPLTLAQWSSFLPEDEDI